MRCGRLFTCTRKPWPTAVPVVTPNFDEPLAVPTAFVHENVAPGLDGVVTVAVPNLRTLAMRNGGVFAEDTVAAYIDGREPRAAHGLRQMPVWGDVFHVVERGEEDVVAARIKVLVWYIAELQYR